MSSCQIVLLGPRTIGFRPLLKNRFGKVKGIAGIVVLSFLLLLVIVLVFSSASLSEIPIVYVLREDEYQYEYDYEYDYK